MKFKQILTLWTLNLLAFRYLVCETPPTPPKIKHKPIQNSLQKTLLSPHSIKKKKKKKKKKSCEWSIYKVS